MSMTSLVSKLSQDLPHVDQLTVVNLINRLGFDDAAKRLGHHINHYDYQMLAGRLAMTQLKNSCPKNLSEYLDIMCNMLNDETYNFMSTHFITLQQYIDKYEHHDYDYDWFSADTIRRTYSNSPNYGDPPCETPCYIWMRVAVQCYHNSPNALENVISSFIDMCEGWYTPASPTIFNAGIIEPQMCSCFLLSVEDDLKYILKEGIYHGGMISKATGGLGFDVSRIRHSEIRNRGKSNGLVPMLKLYNDMVRYVDQGGGKRKGAATVSCRPHHIDMEDFIDITKKVGDHNQRTHDINTCIWTSWLFWKRIKENGKWTLFCPAKSLELNDLTGDEFERAYIKAENDPNIKDKYKKVISARDLFDRMISSMRESGSPYMMNGDAINLKSNQRHIGLVRGPNLCLEIVEVTDGGFAVCNLHNMSMRMYAKEGYNHKCSNMEEELRRVFDYDTLGSKIQRIVVTLNQVIDNNFYPLDKIVDGEIKQGKIGRNNKKHRPIGIGVSGWAEMLHILDLPFEHPVTFILNKVVFACMYFNAIASSVQLAVDYGTYESFTGSPTSEGKLQFDLWKEEFDLLGANPARKAEDDEPVDPKVWGQSVIKLYHHGELMDEIQPTWEDIKRCVVTYGMRNSLLLAVMPTASTSAVRRNCESVEAHQTNLYSRKILNGNYALINRYLIKDLEQLGLWNDVTVEYLKITDGSIQKFHRYVNNNKNKFPKFTGDTTRLKFLEEKYKTMWEISQKNLLRQVADRSRYIDQSCSTNLYFKECTDAKIKASLQYGNMLGLKTLMYYLRQPGANIAKFTADPKMIQSINNSKYQCTDDVCISCT